MPSGYALSNDSVRRLQRMLRWFEEQPQSSPDYRGRLDKRLLVRPALVTTEITTGSTATAGFGNAKLQQRDAIGAYTDILGSDGLARTVKVWNGYTGSVVVGRRIYIIPYGADWELLTADCP